MRSILTPKTHPHTGLPIVPAGFRKPRPGETGDQPIWPVIGAGPDDPDPTDSAKEPKDPPADPANDPLDPPADPDESKKTTVPISELLTERKKRQDAEAKVREYEDSKKTQEERDAEELEQLKTGNASKDVTILQFRVAAEKELPLSMAERLRGSTKEELEADADELKKLIGTPPNDPKKAPKADPSAGGGDGDDEAGGTVASGRSLHAERKGSKK